MYTAHTCKLFWVFWGRPTPLLPIGILRKVARAFCCHLYSLNVDTSAIYIRRTSHLNWRRLILLKYVSFFGLSSNPGQQIYFVTSIFIVVQLFYIRPIIDNFIFIYNFWFTIYIHMRVLSKWGKTGRLVRGTSILLTEQIFKVLEELDAKFNSLLTSESLLYSCGINSVLLPRWLYLPTIIPPIFA